jgi:hypothetical protein
LPSITIYCHLLPSIAISFPYLEYEWIFIGPMCAAWPAYPVFLYLITQIIFYKEHKSCKFLNMKFSPVWFYFLPLGSSHFPLPHQFTSLPFTQAKPHTHTKQHSTACRCLTVPLGRFRTYPFVKN